MVLHGLGPTFDWDSKRHEVINKEEEDEKVSEELSNKKLTFGRPSKIFLKFQMFSLLSL